MVDENSRIAKLRKVFQQMETVIFYFGAKLQDAYLFSI